MVAIPAPKPKPTSPGPGTERTGYVPEKYAQPGENIGALGEHLALRGVNVSLIDLAEWSPMRRDVERAWLEQGGDRPDFFPSGCAACDNGTPNDAENAFKHTGMGPECRVQLKGGPITNVVINGKPVVVRCKGPGGSHRFDTTPDAEGRRHCRDCDQQINVTKGFCPKCGVETGIGDPICKECSAAIVCARDGCGKTVIERNSSRVGDKVYCSAKCSLGSVVPSAWVAPGSNDAPKPNSSEPQEKPSAEERTVPLPYVF
jgi:hypothetical protein